MSSNTTDGSLGAQIKSGLKGIHGVGEAIRGTAMSEVDKAFGTSDRPEAAKNEAIAQKGIADAKAADQHLGHQHGVASNTAGTAPIGTRPAAGAHAAAPGNVGTTREPVAGTTVQEEPGVNQRF